MENRSHALLAGLFTLVFLAAAALVLWWFSGAREQTRTYLLETRGSVTGLNLEAQVRYRGIRAGKVRNIRTDPADPSLLLVEIAIADRYVLTDRTVARLNQQGVTGLAYVMLEESGEGQGKPLDTGGPQPPRIRIQPSLFDKLGDKAGDIATQLAELSARLNRLLNDRNIDNLGRTLDNLAAASEGLKELPQIMAAVKTALSADNLKRLHALLDHLEKTVGAAAPLAAEARSLVQTMDGLARRLDRLAAAGSERLNGETLPRAERLLDEMSAAMHRLDRLLEILNDAPQAVLFGAAPPRPGPGEAGFTAPAAKE